MNVKTKMIPTDIKSKAVFFSSLVRIFFQLQLFLMIILILCTSFLHLPAQDFSAPIRDKVTVDKLNQNSKITNEYPQRIISLSPNITEILFALGLNNRIIAVTDFCKFPPEAEKKPKIGGLMNPNIELIVSLKPDLIIMLETNKDIKEKLSSLKTKFLVVKNETINDVMKSITEIGEAVGEKEEGEKLLIRFQKKLEDVKKLIANLPKEKILIVVDKSPESLQGMYCAGKGNFIDEMATLAGGVNVLQDSTTPYPIVSKEKLIELNPDVILDMSIYGERKEVNNQKIMNSWKSLYSINAVKNNRIHLIDPTSITIPGLRIPENVEYLAKLIHNLNSLKN